MASNRSVSTSSSPFTASRFHSSKAAVVVTRCLSAASTKSPSSSVSTACESCIEDSGEKTGQPPTPATLSMDHRNSLVICNFNTSSNASSIDKQLNADADADSEEEEEEEEENEDEDGDDDDGDAFDSDSSFDNKKNHTYHFTKTLDINRLQSFSPEIKKVEPAMKDEELYNRISDLHISSNILLFFEDKPLLEEGVQSASSFSYSSKPVTTSSLFFSRRKNQYEHILLQESNAVGLEPSADNYFNTPFIIEKICCQSDLNELNKYIFLLDQFARLYLNENSFEVNRQKSPFYPYLFPHPLSTTSSEQTPKSMTPSKRDKFVANYGIDPHNRAASKANASTSTCTRRVCNLNYLDQPFLETYLQIVGKLVQINIGPSTEIESRSRQQRLVNVNLQLAHFCLKIFAQFPNLLRCDLLESSGALQRTTMQLMAAENGFPLPPPHRLLEPSVNEHLDNYGFVAYIRTHFHCLEREASVPNGVRLSVDPTSVEHLIGTLYGRFNLPRLFRLYLSLTCAVRRIFCKAVFRRYPYTRRLSVEAKLLVAERFYQFNFRNRKAPLLDILHDLSPRVGGKSQAEEEEIYQRAMVIFAFRCTLFRYGQCISKSVDKEYVNSEEAETILATALKADGDDIAAFTDSCLAMDRGAHSYDKHPIRFLNEPLCSVFVGHLYKLTIQLTLLMMAYSPKVKGPLYLAELLKIQVEDFEFKTFLQQSLSIIDTELNTITFDLLNRHEEQDNHHLLFDSDGMEDDFEPEPQAHQQERPTYSCPPSEDYSKIILMSQLRYAQKNQIRSFAARDSGSDSCSSNDSTSLNSTVFNGPLFGHSSDDDDDDHTCYSLNDDQSRPSSTTPPLLAALQQHQLSSTFDHNNNNNSSFSDAYSGGGGQVGSLTHGAHHGHNRNQQHHHHHHRRHESHTSSDHHRPPPPNTPVDIPLNLVEKRALLESLKSQGLTLMAPPNNRWSFEECSVCCEVQWLLVRSCCSFAACLDCLARYYSSRIELGALSIECIGSNCHELVYRAEVNARLSPEQKALYSRLLLLSSSESERAKPCPQCNTILTLSAAKERQMKQANNRLFYGTKQLLGTLGLRKSKKKHRRNMPGSVVENLSATGGTARQASPPSSSSSFVYDSLVFKVECDRCKFFWCFKCHSPWHEGLSCKQFMKGDTLLKSWAKNVDYNGQVNAQKCPKCKIYIQRTSGCDHMLCTRCKTDFCYKCGDRLRQVKFFGDHYSRLSVLGCKYRYKPDKPFQRKLIRGTVFGSKLMLLPVLSTVCLCAGAVVLALGVAALPLFGGVRVYRRLRRSGSAGAAAAAAAAAIEAEGTGTAGHRRTGRSNVHALRGVQGDAVLNNQLAMATAAAAAASNEDVWNRTVQMYSARLRNRSGDVIRIPGRFGMNHATNNNNNNDADNTDNNNDTVDQSVAESTTSRGHFHFSNWCNSSLMLHSPDEAYPFFSQLPLDDGEFDSSDDEDEDEEQEQAEPKGNVRTFGSGYSFFPWHNVNQSSAMKLYNNSNRAGRNGVVLKFTEQDLNEIIDESFQRNLRRLNHSHSHHSQNCHLHGRIMAGKSSKSTELSKDDVEVKLPPTQTELLKPSSSGAYNIEGSAAASTAAAAALSPSDSDTDYV